LDISQTASKDVNSGLQMNFFREPEKFWTKSALTLWKRFSESGSTDWTHALQQTESRENEVNNGPSSYSLQRSDLEMLIPSWDTRYEEIEKHFDSMYESFHPSLLRCE
jgi:hypothetical protein